MYQLYIANKNYSSWSLRPWILLKTLHINFEEIMVPFDDDLKWQQFRLRSSSGKVPCLSIVQPDTTTFEIWDSLAIMEYIAENHPQVWAEDPIARAFSRSAAAEMHSGFFHLREMCSMNCRLKLKLKEMTAPLQHDISRLDQLLNEGLS